MGFGISGIRPQSREIIMFNVAPLIKMICYSSMVLTLCAYDCRAEDNCNDVLAHDLANKTVVAGSSDSSQAIHHAQCIQSSSTSSSGSSTGVGGSYGGYGANYNQGSSSSQGDTHSDCGSQSSD